MRTLAAINTERNKLLNHPLARHTLPAKGQRRTPEQKEKDKNKKALMKRIIFLNRAIDVINQIPLGNKREYIVREKRRLEDIILSKEENYEYWIKHIYSIPSHGKAPRTAFNKEIGKPGMTKQIKIMEFLLQHDGEKWKP